MSLILNDESPLFRMADFTYTKRKIDEEEDVQKNEQSKNSWQHQFIKIYFTPNRLDYLEICNGIMSFLMFVCYAIDSYYDDAHPSRELKTPQWIKYCELGLLVIMVADWLVFLFLADNKIFYLFQPQSLISYISIIPTALIRFEVVIDQDIIQRFYLKFWKVLRMLSINRIINVFQRRNLSMARAQFKLMYGVVLMVTISPAIMLTFEN